jgi:hypothetical protein
MRRILSIGLTIALAASGLQSNLRAAGQAGPSQEMATLTGRALRTDLQAFSNATIRLRSVTTGELLRATTSGPSGDYSFPEIPTGNYVVEMVDSTGRIVGMTAPFRVEGGTAPAISIVATSASGAMMSSASAGVSLLGLGPSVTAAVLGAAGAAAVTAVVSTRAEASPSR